MQLPSVGLFLPRCLDDDKEVILIGGYHHFVLPASDTQEGEVVRGVKVTHEVAGLSRQGTQLNTVVSGLRTLGHGAAHKDGLRLSSIFVFSVVNNQKARHTLVLADALNSLVDLGDLFLRTGCWSSGVNRASGSSRCLRGGFTSCVASLHFEFINISIYL